MFYSFRNSPIDYENTRTIKFSVHYINIVLQVIHETSNVELPGFELEEVRKGKQVKETVLAVANSIRTSFGTQSTLILTTFR